MKIRLSFVSNSSSSSFVVILPDNFNIDDLDLSKHVSDYSSEDDLRLSLMKLIKDGEIYGESGDSHVCAVAEVLEDFIAAEFRETSYDQMLLLDNKKVKAVINKKRKKK